MKKILVLAFAVACILCLMLGATALAAPPETIIINEGINAAGNVDIVASDEPAPPLAIIIYEPNWEGLFLQPRLVSLSPRFIKEGIRP